MVKCSRFFPALIGAFVYGCLAPLSILIRMHGAGWYWIGNDTAFGFFMMFVFPFAFAVFVCAFQFSAVRGAFTPISTRAAPVGAFCIVLIVLAFGIPNDLIDRKGERLHQPYMFQDPNLVKKLDSIHRDAFLTGEMKTHAAEYGKLIKEGAPPSDPMKGSSLSTPMLAAIGIFNFINVAIGVAVFCYIWLLATPVRNPDGSAIAEKIPERVTNHLIFTVTAFGLWFPCRAYADWHMNFASVDWIKNYAAYMVLGILLVGCCFIIGFNMAAGSLYTRFVAPAAVIASSIAGVAAWKHEILEAIAGHFSSWDAVYKIGVAAVILALVFYVSSTIHQSGPPGSPTAVGVSAGGAA